MVPCGVIVADAANGDCGQPVSIGAGPTASDALQVLKVAVGAATCEDCVCNVDGAGIIAATDALLVLRVAVGQALPLSCPSCTVTTTSSTTTTVPQGQPQLATGDFPNVAPCANRDTCPKTQASSPRSCRPRP